MRTSLLSASREKAVFSDQQSPVLNYSWLFEHRRVPGAFDCLPRFKSALCLALLYIYFLAGGTADVLPDSSPSHDNDPLARPEQIH